MKSFGHSTRKRRKSSSPRKCAAAFDFNSGFNFGGGPVGSPVIQTVGNYWTTDTSTAVGSNLTDAYTTTITMDHATWYHWVYDLNCYQQAAVWTTWASGTNMGDYQSVGGGYRQPAPQTPEELAASVLAEQDRQRQLEAFAAEERERRAAVDKRAAELLEEHLDEENRERYRRDKVIEITTARKNRYRIRRGVNVRRLDAKGEEEVSYCIHPVEQFPWEDNALAWMLMLKYAEDQFLATANATHIASGQTLPRNLGMVDREAGAGLSVIRAEDVPPLRPPLGQVRAA